MPLQVWITGVCTPELGCATVPWEGLLFGTLLPLLGNWENLVECGRSERAAQRLRPMVPPLGRARISCVHRMRQVLSWPWHVPSLPLLVQGGRFEPLGLAG